MASIRVKRTIRQWLTPQEVGNMVGYTGQFIRSEIKAGELTARQIWSRAGKQGRYQIARSEAERYRERLRGRGPSQSTPPTQTSDSAV